MRLFSYRNRPVHMGPYPSERLLRTAESSFNGLPASAQLIVATDDEPTSILHAVDDYRSILDAVRDGPANPVAAEIPDCPEERANNLKAFCYFLDTTFTTTCSITPDLWLENSYRHPRIDEWYRKCDEAATRPTPPAVEMALGRIGMAANACQQDVSHHTHAIVLGVEFPRDPRPDEPGTKWVQGMQPHRASLRAAETATALAAYLRILGFDARVHSGTSADIDMGRAAVASGMASVEDGKLNNPYVGDRFGLAVVTTTLEIAADLPLSMQAKAAGGPAWWFGLGTQKNAF
ncbi:MAG: NAD-binding oxidoreductase, partial [Woeseiaceae bacterium]